LISAKRGIAPWRRQRGRLVAIIGSGPVEQRVGGGEAQRGVEERGIFVDQRGEMLGPDGERRLQRAVDGLRSTGAGAFVCVLREVAMTSADAAIAPRKKAGLTIFNMTVALNPQ